MHTQPSIQSICNVSPRAGLFSVLVSSFKARSPLKARDQSQMCPCRLRLPDAYETSVALCRNQRSDKTRATEVAVRLMRIFKQQIMEVQKLFTASQMWTCAPWHSTELHRSGILFFRVLCLLLKLFHSVFLASASRFVVTYYRVWFAQTMPVIETAGWPPFCAVGYARVHLPSTPSYVSPLPHKCNQRGGSHHEFL